MDYRRKDLILTSLKNIDEKSAELLSEARKLICNDKYTKSSVFCFNTIFKKYKNLQMQREFCTYCLMFNEVVDDENQFNEKMESVEE